MEASDSTGAQRLQQLVDSFAAKIVWIALKAIITTVITGSIGLAAWYVKDIRDEVKHGASRMAVIEDKQATEHTAVSLTEQRVQNLEKVSDQTVRTLQQMGEQLARDHDDINQLKSDRRR